MEKSQSQDSGIKYIRLSTGRMVRFVDDDPLFREALSQSHMMLDKELMSFMLDNKSSEQMARRLLAGFSRFTPIHQAMTKYWFTYFVEHLLDSDDQEVIDEWIILLQPLGFEADQESVTLQDEDVVYNTVKEML